MRFGIKFAKKKKPEKASEGRKLENQFTGSENINFCRVQYHSELFCSFQSIMVSGRHLEVGVKKKFARHGLRYVRRSSVDNQTSLLIWAQKERNMVSIEMSVRMFVILMTVMSQ